MPNQGYDAIGDIHGHANALRRLLVKLGYHEHRGVFRHTERKVIFVGDFIDRGPEQREVLRIARVMCEAGTAFAILGNHEFNAIGWATSDGNGGYLREHSDKNAKQHQEFLRQLGDGSPAYHNTIRWFRNLPVWLEFPGLRVVHACWHEPSRVALRPYLDCQNCFTEDGILEALRRDSKAYAAAGILLIENLWKGVPRQLFSHVFEEVIVLCESFGGWLQFARNYDPATFRENSCSLCSLASSHPQRRRIGPKPSILCRTVDASSNMDFDRPQAARPSSCIGRRPMKWSGRRTKANTPMSAVTYRATIRQP